MEESKLHIVHLPFVMNGFTPLVPALELIEKYLHLNKVEGRLPKLVYDKQENQ